MPPVLSSAIQRLASLFSLARIPLAYPSPFPVFQPSALTSVAQCRHMSFLRLLANKSNKPPATLSLWKPYELPVPEDSQYNIYVMGEKGKRSAMSLDQLARDIRPGRFLIPTKTPTKQEANDPTQSLSDGQAYQDYTFTEVRPYTVKGPKMRTYGQDARKLKFRMSRGKDGKLLTFDLASPPSFYQSCLDRAYAFLDAGHPVEFGLRYSGSHIPKRDRLKEKDNRIWPWLHVRFPHLRPDFIRGAMPEGTCYVIPPFSDGRGLKFVMKAPPGKNQPVHDWTSRLLRRKALALKMRRNEERQRGS